METVVLQIGNSDNKLTQEEWSHFCTDTDKLIKSCLGEYGKIHFSAPSVGWEGWQNACWIFSVSDDIMLMFVKMKISEIRRKYNQDSVAWAFTKTEFI